jgi:hypothetical protein
MLKMFESDILQYTDYMGILSTLKKRAENITNVSAVAQVSIGPVCAGVYTLGQCALACTHCL